MSSTVRSGARVEPSTGSGLSVVVIAADPFARQAHLSLAQSAALRAQAYPSAEEYFVAGEPAAPGCVVLDMAYRCQRGLAAIQLLATREPPHPVVVLAERPDISTAVQAMRAGATDFLDRDGPRDELLRALLAAIDHGRTQRRAIHARRRHYERLMKLNDGERNVLDMLVDGKSNKEMASLLGLSVRAIEDRRAKLMHKMHANSLADLLRTTLSLVDLK